MRPCVARERNPGLARDIEQSIGADHVGLNKWSGTVDRAIHMGFRRQVHDRVGLPGGEHLAHRGMIGDVGADQGVVVARALQRLFRGRVGQFVNIDNTVIRRPRYVTHNGGADETASARQQHPHPHPSLNEPRVATCQPLRAEATRGFGCERCSRSSSFRRASSHHHYEPRRKGILKPRLHPCDIRGRPLRQEASTRR